MAQKIELIRAWLENGAPPIEDLAPIMNLHDINLIRIFSGKLEVDEGTKKLFATIFDRPVHELFPEEDNNNLT